MLIVETLRQGRCNPTELVFRLTEYVVAVSEEPAERASLQIRHTESHHAGSRLQTHLQILWIVAVGNGRQSIRLLADHQRLAVRQVHIEAAIALLHASGADLVVEVCQQRVTLIQQVVGRLP